MPDTARKTGVFLGTDATNRDLDMAAVAVAAAIVPLAIELPDTSVDYEMRTMSVQWAESPSVRLARWEDGHPERHSMTEIDPDGEWHAVLVLGGAAKTWSGKGSTRDEARTAALDQAEGVQDTTETATGERKRHKADGSIWEAERSCGRWGWHLRCVQSGRVEGVGGSMRVAHEYWEGDNWAAAPATPEGGSDVR